jgi:uncharacterized membrane protein
MAEDERSLLEKIFIFISFVLTIGDISLAILIAIIHSFYLEIASLIVSVLLLIAILIQTWCEYNRLKGHWESLNLKERGTTVVLIVLDFVLVAACISLDVVLVENGTHDHTEEKEIGSTMAVLATSRLGVAMISLIKHCTHLIGVIKGTLKESKPLLSDPTQVT